VTCCRTARKFKNIDEFKQLLLKGQGQLARAFTEKLLTYSTGGAPHARRQAGDRHDRGQHSGQGLRIPNARARGRAEPGVPAEVTGRFVDCPRLFQHKRPTREDFPVQLSRRKFLRAAGVSLALPGLGYFMPNRTFGAPATPVKNGAWSGICTPLACTRTSSFRRRKDGLRTHAVPGSAQGVPRGLHGRVPPA